MGNPPSESNYPSPKKQESLLGGPSTSIHDWRPTRPNTSGDCRHNPQPIRIRGGEASGRSLTFPPSPRAQHTLSFRPQRLGPCHSSKDCRGANFSKFWRDRRFRNVAMSWTLIHSDTLPTHTGSRLIKRKIDNGRLCRGTCGPPTAWWGWIPAAVGRERHCKGSWPAMCEVAGGAGISMAPFRRQQGCVEVGQKPLGALAPDVLGGGKEGRGKGEEERVLVTRL